MSINHSISLKEINKKNILKIIFEKGPISRVDISRMLKISRPTTTAYVNELLEERIVVETGKGQSSSSGGKRAILISFNEKSGFILGVMIGVKSIRFALSDFRLNLLNNYKIDTEEGKGSRSVIRKIINNLKKIIKENDIKDKLIGIGIGVTGLVDSTKGEVIFSPNLKGWRNIKLKKLIEDEVGLPIFIENECRVQAIAEKKFGLAREYENFVCIETGIGVGAGVFIDNKVLIGNMGMAGEVGHIITNMAGDRVCHCGNIGCLETLCSTKYLLEDIIEDIKNNNLEDDYNLNEFSENMIYELYEKNDEIVKRNVEKNAEFLGIGISDTIKMFSPEIIIIHGESIKFGESYLEKVIKSVSENTFPKVIKDFNIQFSKLGDNVGLMGAASVVFDNIFDLGNTDLGSRYIIKKVLN